MLCLSTGSVAWLWSFRTTTSGFERGEERLLPRKGKLFHCPSTDNTTEEMIEQWRYWLHGAKFDGFTLECIVPGPPKCLWPKVGSCFFWVTLRKARGTLRECGHHMGGRGTLRESGHCGREGHFEGEWAPWEGGAL